MLDMTELEQLLQKIGEQDIEAFRALYDKTSSALMAVTSRICRQRDMAEDALQETYVQIWRHAANFDTTRSSAMSWMSVIARNRAIDHIRRKFQPGQAGSTPAEYEVENLPSLAADVEVRSDLRALASCLENLPLQHREAILRAYYEGWDRIELADHFQIPVNTLKTWLRRGLTMLRACMDGDKA